MAPKSKNFLNFIVSFLQRFLGFSCEAASPRLRARERVSKQEREGGRKGGGAQIVKEQARVGSRAGTWEVARAWDARGRAQEARTKSRALRARSREPGVGVGDAEGALLGWPQLRLEERYGGGGAERGSGAVHTLGGEQGSQRRGSGAALEKTGSGGVATRCSRSSRPAFLRFSRARRRKGGGEEKER